MLGEKTTNALISTKYYVDDVPLEGRRLVKLGTEPKEVSLAVLGTEEPIGVHFSGCDKESGDCIAVLEDNAEVFIEAGAAVAIGDKIAAGPGGYGYPAVPGDWYIGTALTAATDPDQAVLVKIEKGQL